MKRAWTTGTFLFFLTTLLVFQSHAAPDAINYQTVVRDAEGNLLESTDITFRFSLRIGTSSGPLVFEEVHHTTTNEMGLANLLIGDGDPVTGAFGDLSWHESPHYLEVELDLGNGFQRMGSQPFASVPYAKYTDLAGKVVEMHLDELSDVDATTPEEGQFLIWNGDAWIAAEHESDVSYTEGTGINIYGDTITALVGDAIWNAAQLQSFEVAADTPVIGEVLKWNGSAWAPGEDLESNWDRNGNNVFTEEDNIGIMTAHPQAALHVDEASVLFGRAPEGNNQRFMWDAEHGALRAGEAANLSWDPDSLGNNSTALGNGTIAKGDLAFAWGDGSRAESTTATAFGRNTIASGLRATAWGFESKASGTYATAFGYRSNASGNYSTAWGYESEASGPYATAIGRDNLASAGYAFVHGSGNKATEMYATAIGNNANASGLRSFAAGSHVEASGSNSFLFGAGNGTTSMLENDVNSSFMVGFSTSPTFFVQNSRVGINTNAPNYDMHIYQQASGLALYHNNQPNSREWSFRNTASGTGNYLDFRHEGGLVSYIDESDGEYYVSSDRRLKEDIRPLDNVLDRLLQLEPVNYRYKNRNGDKSVTGFIAQDVKELFPAFVNLRESEEGKERYSITYSGFAVIAIQAIQEQQTTIDKQQKMLDRQEQLLEQQQAVLEELTNRLEKLEE